ncbi:MAG: NUDIX domain-containing protein [Bacteroidales bacterium]|nr:NUDIX domain-containing protein [Bacteroidales bacterium]
MLMILHRDIWDLPKGMLEKNENVKECAVREVTEETGVKNLTAGEELCVTHHTYPQDGRTVLKHTHWFEMTSADDGLSVLAPQLEEEITKAEWLGGESLRKALENTYASVREIIETATGCR